MLYSVSGLFLPVEFHDRRIPNVGVGSMEFQLNLYSWCRSGAERRQHGDESDLSSDGHVGAVSAERPRRPVDVIRRHEVVGSEQIAVRPSHPSRRTRARLQHRRTVRFCSQFDDLPAAVGLVDVANPLLPYSLTSFAAHFLFTVANTELNIYILSRVNTSN